MTSNNPHKNFNVNLEEPDTAHADEHGDSGEDELGHVAVAVPGDSELSGDAAQLTVESRRDRRIDP